MTDKKIKRMVDDGKLDTVAQAMEGGEHPAPQAAVVQPAAGTPATRPAVGTALEKLRAPLESHEISFLPKQTKQQKEALAKDSSKGIRCATCGGWHHRDALHVPYAGHAAVTNRLLNSDLGWEWEPVAWTPEGLPRLDTSGGLWIRLTVDGMTRLGYGHAASKPNQDPGAREKEVIGDAIRNAAMRFGVALELWHKGELHPDVEAEMAGPDESAADKRVEESIAGAPDGTFISDEQRDRILARAAAAGVDARKICDNYGIEALPQLHADQFDHVMERLNLTINQRAAKQKALPIDGDVLDDEIKY